MTESNQDCDGEDLISNGGPVGPDTTCNGLTVTVDMNTNGGVGAGTSGDDVILGTPGDDVITGDAGNDTICGGEGNDDIRGEVGNDTILWRGRR